MLPIRMLDGGQAVEALLDLVERRDVREEFDIELGERNISRAESRWKKRIQRVLSYGTISLGSTTILCNLLLLVIR